MTGNTEKFSARISSIDKIAQNDSVSIQMNEFIYTLQIHKWTREFHLTQQNFGMC